MNVTQPDSRTIRVQTDEGVTFHIPYRFFWNGHERQPESIALEANPAGGRGPAEVRAFFLFGTIRDRIARDSSGITILRSWSIMTPGGVRLSVDVEFDESPGLACLFPGVHVALGMPRAAVSFLGEKTSYPAAVFLSLGANGALLFSRSGMCGEDISGIGICHREVEDEPSRLCVEVRFPGVEEPAARVGPKPAHVEEKVEATIESPGSLERSHEIYVVVSRRERIQTAGAAAVLGKLSPEAVKRSTAAPTVDTRRLAEAITSALSTHLCQEGGVAGIRELPGNPWLSSMAGLGLGIAMRKLFPKDARLQELALRLADFSLKGQLPSGLLFESYHHGSGEWRGVRGRGDRTLISISHSARIADLLLVLAEDLASHGLPHEKYYLAGLRFVEFFLDEKGRLSMPGRLHLPGDRRPFAETAPGALDLGGVELFFPMSRVLAKTGRDRYKKALDAIVKRFSAFPWDAFHLPSSRVGRSPDSAASLLAARLFTEMRRLGYRPAEAPASGAAAAKTRAAESTRLFASLLVPWIRIHGLDPGKEESLPLSGGIADSFTCQRVLFSGNETAWLLLELGELPTEPEVRSLLKGLARLCLGCSRQVPLGTAFFQHTRWDAEGKPEDGRARLGPVDSRRLAREIESALRIADEFPKI